MRHVEEQRGVPSGSPDRASARAQGHQPRLDYLIREREDGSNDFVQTGYHTTNPKNLMRPNVLLYFLFSSRGAPGGAGTGRGRR